MERERERMMHQNFQSFAGTRWDSKSGASSSFGWVFSVGQLEHRTSEGEDEIEGSMIDLAGAGLDEKK